MHKSISVSISIAFSWLAACSSETSSKLDATNIFQGKRLRYWYETLTLDESLDNSFLKYHKANKDLLLGNRNTVIPETLKGLWFMDGNPVGDKTFNVAKAKPGRDAQEDFYFEVNTPTTFSWTNIPQSHKTIRMIDAVTLTYGFQFLDCPSDVKHERETKWGMKDGGCTKADKEFAIITPMVQTPWGQIRVSQGIAYFDMYVRPKEGDFYVWERRSKVFEVTQTIINKFTALVRKETKVRDFHRYAFTQVLDKEGTPLQSLPRLVKSVKDTAAQNGKDLKDLMFYLCYQGAQGCDREVLAGEATQEIDQGLSAEFGAVPVL